MGSRPPDTPLRRADLAADPLEQFRQWFAHARTVTTMAEAMALCTADSQGRPSGRMVLLKGEPREGFEFYTNYESRKSAELSANPHAALVFWWVELDRQVRVEGTVERLEERQSDRYFASRPRGARIGAIASRQSRPITDRPALESEVAAIEERHSGTEQVPRPTTWGGFRLRPEAIEFWQGRHDRLHDRFLYLRKEGGDWSIERLQP
jgi:pyridoxamine 5'-phosphate oxidase